VTAYVDELGNPYAEYAYDAFGNTISQSGDLASTFSHRFSTKYFDPETGLYYYGYRYYSPELGRWVSCDPIEEQGGMNLYGFVWNNGIRGIDILGLVGTPAGSWTMAANTVQGVLDYYNTKVYSHNSEVTKYDPRNNEIFLGTGWWEKGAGWRQAQNGEWWVGPIEDGNGKLYNDYAGKNAAKAHELLSVVNYRFPDALGMYGEGAGYTSIAGASHITGLHQLALVYEWGVWAKERPDYLTCAEVTRRESDYIKHKTPLHSKYSANQGYIDEAKRLVKWICDCECGNKKAEEKPFESFIYGRERTLKSSKLKERITLQSKFTCKDKKISGGLDVKLETQK
jgi:RHS repeat-associated protein